MPPANRAYVRLVEDDHGQPSLVTDHTAPASGAEWASLDALDWYGFWKPFDALTACAFDGTWCKDALGNTPERRFMGVWSDGTPVAGAQVIADPGPPLTPAATPAR